MAGQGSAGNVLAALCSFFIPGLGQLLQGRLLMAIVQFCLAAILWFVLLGWVIHLWSILDAALFKKAIEGQKRLTNPPRRFATHDPKLKEHALGLLSAVGDLALRYALL